MFLPFAILHLILWYLLEATPLTLDYRLVTERDLRRDIFKFYDKLVRPVATPDTAVDVQVGVSPLMLREVDEKHQIVVLETWMQMKWKDDYLTWDPIKYGNITVLRLPNNEVWKPDLALYTASPDTSMFPTVSNQVLIYSNGEVLWVSSFTISSRCPMLNRTEKNYIECNIQIGSWTYSSKLLNPELEGPEVYLSDFQDINPDWKLLKMKVNKVSTYYPCCPGEDYPVLHFNATLKSRRSFSMSDSNKILSQEY